MKKFLAITIAVAFLFAGGASIVGAQQSATDLNGIKISGGAYLSFVGSYLSGQQKAQQLHPVSLSQESGNALFTLFLDKDFSNGGTAHVKIKGGNESSKGGLAIGNFRAGLDDNTGIGNEGVWVENAWYQHPFLEGALKVKIGKTHDFGLDNAVVDGVSTYFLGDPTYSGAAGSDVGAYGLIFDYSPLSALDITYGYLTREHQTEDSNFSHPLQVITFNYKGIPVAIDNFRIGYWQSLSGAEFADYRVGGNEYQYDPVYNPEGYDYRDPETQTSYIRRGGKANPQGIFLSLDKELVETVGLFLKFGLRLDKTNGPTGDEAGQSWQAGTKIKGSLWGRANDSLFIGIGQATYQTDILGKGNKVETAWGYDDSGNYSATYEKVKPETHFEVNYKFSLADQVTLVAYGVYVCDIYRKGFTGSHLYPGALNPDTTATPPTYDPSSPRNPESQRNSASVTNYGYGGGLALQISF